MSSQLNTMQGYFIYWNAERLNISVDESLKRFSTSFWAVNGHHSGEFKEFCNQSHNLYLPFFTDEQKTVYETYQFHSYMHFLRMLSLPDPMIRDNDTVITDLETKNEVTIFDFGCGLAQWSIFYAKKLKEKNTQVKLHLIDIPTIRQNFLKYVCEQLGIDMDFYPSLNKPGYFPEVPPTDLAITNEVFEHLYDPITYFNKMDKYMKKGSFMVTNIKDHKEIFTHVTPNLKELRQAFVDKDYKDISQSSIYLECGNGIGSKQLYKKQ